MRFLIAGYGSIGRRHLRNLRALGQDDIVLYRTGKSTLPEDELAGLTVEYDLGAALAHQPDAVIIANPTANHLDVALPAAEAGCHILMEKPISHSLAGVAALGEALRRGGGKLLVGFQFRFHPGLQKLSELICQQTAGRPLSARVEWGEFLPAWHPWEDYRQSYSARADLGGGVVVTLSHPLDYLRWLLGEVNGLWAFTGQISDLEIEVEDMGEIGLRFESGAVASLHLDYYRRPPVHRLEITCTEGLLRWDNADGAARWVKAEDGTEEVYLPPADFERNHLFLAEMQHFMDVMQGKAEPVCGLEGGQRALELALAVHQSAAEGRRITW